MKQTWSSFILAFHFWPVWKTLPTTTALPCLLKATSVDGIYTADPKVYAEATKFPNITYSEMLRLNLRVMDAAAVSLCRDNNMPMMVFSMREPGNIVRVVKGEGIGSLVTA